MKKTKAICAILLAPAVFLLALGCAGGPTPQEPAPDWVLSPPEDDADYSYFVGYGTSAGGDTAEARTIATNTMLDEILRYIGVRVTSETTAEARGSLEDFKTDITQIVRQTGASRVTGFTIADTWTDLTKPPEVTVYILGRYDRDELEKEKDRIEQLFIEEDRAISGPESEGNSLAAEGRHYEAAIKFITAAGAALKSKVANADIKYKRNMDRAMESVEGISLVKLNDGLQGMAGEALPEPLVLKIVNGSGYDDPGIPDATFIVSYQEYHAPTGRMRYREAEVKSNQEGLAAFEHPVPRFVGQAKVSFSLDLSSYLRVLDDAKGSDRDLVDGLEELLVRKKATFQITVASNAQNIKTGVFIVDLDKEGDPVGAVRTSDALMAELPDYDLMRLSLSGSPAREEEEILADLKTKYKDRVARLIVGTSRIIETRESDGKILAKAQASVRVIDMATDDLLLTVQTEKSGLGSNEDAAIQQAYKEAGKLLGTKIRNDLL